jgi:hypothetical protein
MYVAIEKSSYEVYTSQQIELPSYMILFRQTYTKQFYTFAPSQAVYMKYDTALGRIMKNLSA